jgi:hypothetical protein|tara:strand:+ start:806 stop:1051 length:246 start_codon:yes stop_codon:yes gene_type:complete
MQTDRDAQLDRIIKAAETLAKVFDYIEERATYIHDAGLSHNRMCEEKILEKIFEIIKDSGVFSVQRTAMTSLVISIINDFV